MAVPATKRREIVLQMLFGLDIGQGDLHDMAQLLQKELKVDLDTAEEAKTRVQKLLEHRDAIDERLKGSSEEYAFERIQSVERNILRLGVYELLYDDDIPPKVAIAEAIRLTRKFGSPEGASFVNAILDKILGEV